ncbi:hypothetical protein ABW20_dc0103293 [Dactylellina cionopaga]|nr:hypothetical protein ABW20_dc0103293 [Dactylellina cionopaga]
MDHPYSPPTAFPLSFFEEDMMLFNGSGSDIGAAWADMGMGQGRSVSSIMDPYHLDLQPSTGLAGNNNPTSPATTLQSPLTADGGSMGFLSPTAGPAGGVVVRTGRTKKRGSNVDAMGNPLPLPSSYSSSVSSSSSIAGMMFMNPATVAAAAAAAASHHHHHLHNHNNIIIHNNTNNNHFNHIDHINHINNINGIIIDAEMTNTDVDSPEEGDDNNNHNNHNDANAAAQQSSGLPPAQKRRRRDTSATNNGGSNTEGFSSGDDTGNGTASGKDDRRDSIIGPDGKRQERPRLTEEEKKNNHIASEQKRRMAIRDGFDRLTELVPGIEGQGRSESIVLKKTVDHMRKVIEDRRNLIQQVQELGGEVPQELMLR